MPHTHTKHTQVDREIWRKFLRARARDHTDWFARRSHDRERERAVRASEDHLVFVPMQQPGLCISLGLGIGSLYQSGSGDWVSVSV